MLETAGMLAPEAKPSVINLPYVLSILCLLSSRIHYFNSHLQRKVTLSSRPQGGNVTLLLGV